MSSSTRELYAELEILRHYDATRRSLGHDYGAGQRVRELRRLERELGLHAHEVGDAEPTSDELAAAFERVGRPKMRRLEREDYRSQTPATRRTLDAWRRLERRYGVEKGTLTA